MKQAQISHISNYQHSYITSLYIGSVLELMFSYQTFAVFVSLLWMVQHGCDGCMYFFFAMHCQGLQCTIFSVFTLWTSMDYVLYGHCMGTLRYALFWSFAG